MKLKFETIDIQSKLGINEKVEGHEVVFMKSKMLISNFIQ